MATYTQYTGTFTKKDGSRRTMNFIKVDDLPSNMISESHRKGQTSSQSSSQVVYDTQAGGFRTFNFGTQVGSITSRDVSLSFDNYTK